jgi:hypothetical protein
MAGVAQIAADLLRRQSRQDRALCQEVTPVHTALRNCTRDEGWPFEIGNQALISAATLGERDPVRLQEAAFRNPD